MAGVALREVLAGIAAVPAIADRAIGGVTLDSRAVAANDLFIALPGARVDARAYIDDAVARGAGAIVYEAADAATRISPGVPAYAVAGLRAQLGAIAERVYGRPSQRLVVIGVTGTNGKTTCTQLLAQALDNISARESALGSDHTKSRAARSARLPLPLCGRGNEGEGSLSHALTSYPLPLAGEGELEESLKDRGAEMRVRAPSLSGRGGEGSARARCAIIGTLGYGFPDALDAGLHTTPDCATVHRLLARFADDGAGWCAMEVSSHALDQGRVDRVAFKFAVFTNLSRDHLDYHGDMRAYGDAKARLFDADLAAAVINCDDAFGRELIARIGGRYPVLTYGRHAGDVHAREVVATRAGLVVRAVTPQGETELRAPLFGEFNAINLLAVLAALMALGLALEDASARLNRVRPVPGRAERFGGTAATPLVVVDYAHSPDALEQILRALRAHTRGRLWCVFGCGGDRDRGKRPRMGAIAEQRADVVIITDDNPRHESGDAIVADIIQGMRAAPLVLRDRRQAIARALREAGPDDIVLVAGKGHEDYQQVGDLRTPYSDRDTVRVLLGAVA